MKKILLAGALLGAAALAGCQTVSQFTTTVATTEAQVQADAQLACGFIPTIATIAAFIPGAGAAVSDAATIAQAICAAVAAAPVPKVQSAKLRSLKMGGAVGVPVTVGQVRLPSGKVVTISGTFTQ